MNGEKFYFIVSKNPNPKGKEPYLLLITNLEEKAKKVVKMYAKRWKIEHCFKHLKSNGFNLEVMNLEGDTRCDLLLAFVVFAYIISIHEVLKTYQNVAQVTYTDGTENKRESVFRYGISKVTIICINFATFLAYIGLEIQQAKTSYWANKMKNVQ